MVFIMITHCKVWLQHGREGKATPGDLPNSQELLFFNLNILSSLYLTVLHIDKMPWRTRTVALNRSFS